MTEEKARWERREGREREGKGEEKERRRGAVGQLLPVILPVLFLSLLPRRDIFFGGVSRRSRGVNRELSPALVGRAIVV